LASVNRIVPGRSCRPLRVAGLEDLIDPGEGDAQQSGDLGVNELGCGGLNEGALLGG
jgi:hypothetical protein